MQKKLKKKNYEHLMNVKKESEKVGLKLYISQSHQEKKGEESNQQN